METILITTGLACIIIAIVGGGLEAFNLKVPSIISSIKRQILLGIFGIVILVFGIFRDSSKNKPEPEKGSDKQADTELTYFKDGDGDGFGNKLIRVKSSTQPTNYVSDSTDDDDNDPGLNNVSTARFFYSDIDKDGFGDKNRSKKANKNPSDYVTNSQDCDDGDYNAKPTQTGWYTRRNSGGSFDYNCDGIEKREKENIHSKIRVVDHHFNPPRESFRYKEGWKDRVPDCGQTGIYIAIQNGVPVQTNRTQRCN